MHDGTARVALNGEPVNPSQIVYGEKVISGTYYGSVRPNIDFPILANLDLENRSTSTI
jgi:Zn-dependent alcohol dehydrogenase